MRATLAALTIAAILAREVVAADPPWRESFDAALAEATEKNRPILVALGNDDERVCVIMAATHYRQDELLAQMQNYVCLVASPSRHELIEVGGRKVCGLYGTITCEQHIAVERKVRALFFGADLVTVPQHLVLAANGKLLHQCEFFLTTVQLTRFLQRHMSELRPDLALGEGVAQEVESGKVGENLREALRSDDTEKRAAAAKVLSELDPELILREIDTTFAKLNSEQKGAMLMSLATPGTLVAVPILARHLVGSDAVVRSYAARALGRLGDTQAIIPLRRRITTEPDATARGAVVDALGRFAASDAGASKAIVQAASDRENAVRAHAYVALGTLDAVGDQLLLKGLESKDRSLCGAAVWACGKRKLKAAERKIEAARRVFGDINFRVAAESALRRIRGDEVEESFYDELKAHFIER